MTGMLRKAFSQGETGFSPSFPGLLHLSALEPRLPPFAPVCYSSHPTVTANSAPCFLGFGNGWLSSQSNDYEMKESLKNVDCAFPSVSVSYCYVPNHHKFRHLKQQMFKLSHPFSR